MSWGVTYSGALHGGSTENFQFRGISNFKVKVECINLFIYLWTSRCAYNRKKASANWIRPTFNKHKEEKLKKTCLRLKTIHWLLVLQWATQKEKSNKFWFLQKYRSKLNKSLNELLEIFVLAIVLVSRVDEWFSFEVDQSDPVARKNRIFGIRPKLDIREISFFVCVRSRLFGKSSFLFGKIQVQNRSGKFPVCVISRIFKKFLEHNYGIQPFHLNKISLERLVAKKIYLRRKRDDPVLVPGYYDYSGRTRILSWEDLSWERSP